MNNRTVNALYRQLRRLAVERMPEACLGCGFERECSVHGCTVINKAIETMKELDTFDKTQSAALLKTMARQRKCVEDAKTYLILGAEKYAYKALCGYDDGEEGAS